VAFACGPFALEEVLASLSIRLETAPHSALS
jgi:hypothetical protein